MATKKILLKRGLAVNLPQLDTGEPAFTTDGEHLYIGNGDHNVEIPKKENFDLLLTEDKSSLVGAINEIYAIKLDDVVEYGVRWVVGQANSVGERVKRVNGELFIGAATNLVANIGIDAAIVVNSFDSVDIFNTETEIIDGNVMVKRKLYYHKLEFVKEDGVDYEYSWMCERKLAGYIRPRIFVDDNGKDIDYAYLSKYEASEDGTGKARSISGAFPRVSISRGNARKAARKNDGNGDNTDSRWGIMDLAEYQYHIIVPFEIEFATRHSQSIMYGVTDLPYNDAHVALNTEEGNNFVITKAQAAAFVIGQTISIGASRGTSDVVADRVIDDILVDTPEVGKTTLVISGAPISITEGNVIATRAWMTGKTNLLTASSGVFTANNWKYPISFRGYENPWGNIYKFIDGGKVVNHKLWVSEERSAYNDVASVGGAYASPFMAVSYLNAQADGYVKVLGYDKTFPYARLPVVAGDGANNVTYYADYYYQSTGDRTLYVGGRWNYGSDAGLFLWYAANTLGNSYVYLGFRLSFRPLKGVN